MRPRTEALLLVGVWGAVAALAVAMVGWSLGVFPLFRIARNVFGSACAWFAVAGLSEMERL